MTLTRTGFPRLDLVVPQDELADTIHAYAKKIAAGPISAIGAEGVKAYLDKRDPKWSVAW